MMKKQERTTLVVHGRHAMKEARLTAARSGSHGLQVMSIEQLAARLAGGFVQHIDQESLRAAIQSALPETDMGELESIKNLPGMVDAAADTLHKIWRAEIDLASRAKSHPRLQAIARLEEAVLDQLPSGMLRPVDIVGAATARIEHSPALLGPIEIVGRTELSPCWRPLLKALTAHVTVHWVAGSRSIPEWLEETGIKVSNSPANTPEVSVVSAATAYHEAVEAMRWMRSLLASGVSPSDIAIASAMPAEYDDHFLALRSDSNINLHFVHGIKVIATQEGQKAATLADILVRELSQTRLRRLVALCPDAVPFKDLPEGWQYFLPTDAPLSTPASWDRLLNNLNPEQWPDGAKHAPKLRDAVDLLMKGYEAAEEIGEAFLKGRALDIWRKALRIGSAAMIDATLETLKQDDGLEASVSATWMPASDLAMSPRRYVRLLGLNSSRWPRTITEDRLIPAHIIKTNELDPLPVNLADRRDFETILATTTGEVCLSCARRGSDGRLLGRSPLLGGHGEGIYLRRNSTPKHAFSETDRSIARLQEFAKNPQAVSAQTCWRDWHRPEITAHDGLIRADHPLVNEILDRTQSASSLRRLLRNPLGFVWVYAFGWREPQSSIEPLTLDALSMGDLVHTILDHALRDLEATGGLVSADVEKIEAAINKAEKVVSEEWQNNFPVPPAVIWRRTLGDAHTMAVVALSNNVGAPPGARAFSEVPFGGSDPKSDANIPWDSNAPVEIPDTGFRINGYIDRLDISDDGKRVHVRDYKTGKPPSSEFNIKNGKELQRCLYAFAVKALLGKKVEVSASLLYLREPVTNLDLDDPESVLTEVASYLRAARASLTDGAVLPGPSIEESYFDLSIALPANAKATYWKRKQEAVRMRMGEATQVWDAE